MAENIPSIPSGAVPPKKETGKVQPKKETVRINLPPKPSTAPTIKLPTLPPGAPAAPAPMTSAPVLSHAAPTAPPRATAAPTATGGARPSAPGAGRPSAPAAMAPTVKLVDKILAIAAAVIGLAAVGSTVYMLWVLEHPGA